MKRSNILIYGGRGFIGSHLVKHLGKKHNVMVGAANIVGTDILTKEIKLHKPDVIINLAAYNQMSWHGENYMQSVLVNFVGVANIIEASKKLNCHIIHTGSSSEIVDMNSTYAILKRAATDYCQARNDRNITVLRPFSVYGPGEDKRRFIPTVIDKCKKGKKLSLAVGVHDWVYIDDVCAAYELAVEQQPLYGEISTGIETPNWEVVSAVSELIGKDIKASKSEEVSKIEHWKGNPANWLRDWYPKISLYHGLERTINESE